MEREPGEVEVSQELFDSRLSSREFPFDSGVWRFKELVHPLVEKGCVASKAEGNTRIYSHGKVDSFTGCSVRLKHEGENPTGSFKDRGMTAGVSEALRQGARVVACASTGNTSASLASYAALAGLQAVVFIPDGKIAFGKLAQTMAYGARVLKVKGNFDDAMRLVQESASELGLYLLNSVNPWRIEGQKAIAFELLQQSGWVAPDWVCLPAGNLGNTTALGKAFLEARELGLVDSVPRIASVQASGANPFYCAWRDSAELVPVAAPHTVASAINIGNPLSWRKAMRVIRETRGVVTEVSDEEILCAKEVVDAAGVGCEPASAAGVAGARKLRQEGVIGAGESVVCILTGNILKDPDTTVNYHLGNLQVKPARANAPTPVEADVAAIRRALGA